MYGIEVIYIGSAGHLRRYKVVDANGKCATDDRGPAVFRTLIEAESFIAARVPKGKVMRAEPQLRDSNGDGWYTAIYPSSYAERGFVASDDDEAIAITENLAHESGQTLSLYRSLRMHKLSKVCDVLPDRGF